MNCVNFATAGESVVVVTASEKEDSTLSKAVQTVLKEAESAKVGIQSTTQQRPQPQPMTKETPEVASQSQVRYLLLLFYLYAFGV